MKKEQFLYSHPVTPVKVIVDSNGLQYDKGNTDFQNAWEDLQNGGHMEDAWAMIASISEEDRIVDESNGPEYADHPG